ncbi:MAG: hypothetical protein QOG80_1078 [Pseudonocardiales bacterium]|jgi:hypothetical protein|nr:hypothetical protein [Pseudonocardiales bacterium]
MHTLASTFDIPRPQMRAVSIATVIALAVSAALLGVISSAAPASAATAPVDLGGAASYSVIGGETVTNTGPTVLGGSLAVSPGSAVTGFPPGLVGGATHAGDAQALQAEGNVLTAWNAAAGRPPTDGVAGDVVGQTLTAGTYKSTSSLALSGTLTLDGQGDPSSVFIFQVASTLITATSSHVALINGTQACNVFWQVGSSATLGTTSVFKGTILALTSITVTTGVRVEGRAFAHDGAVTLDQDVFSAPGCDTTPPTAPVVTSPVSTTPGITTPVVTRPAATRPAVGPPGSTQPVTTWPVTTTVAARPPQLLTPHVSTPGSAPPTTTLARTGFDARSAGLVALIAIALGTTLAVISSIGRKSTKRR